MTVSDPSAGGRADLPERRISLSQLAAYNMAAFRKAARLGQQEFGEQMGGWSAASVSAAERSWDGARVRKFDADELMRIAAILNLPLAALFVPPEDNGIAVRYVLDPPLPVETGSELNSLLPYAFPDFGEDYGSSPVWDAYRQRLIAAGLGRLDKSMDLALHTLAEAQRVAGATVERARIEASETAFRAQEEAERVIRMARDQSRQLPGENSGAGALNGDLEKAAQVLAMAQGTADEVISAARNEADETLARVRREVDRILEKGRSQAEQITADAATRAEALERDAQERHRYAMGSLVTQREELERRVEDLRAFESEYRTRFNTFLERTYREFWAGVRGVDPDDLLRKMRRQAEESGSGSVTALLLGEDGAYRMYSMAEVANAAEGRPDESTPVEQDEGQQDRPEHVYEAGYGVLYDPQSREYRARKPDEGSQ